MKRHLLLLILTLCISSPMLAQYEEKDFQIRPIAGIWFGPMAPFPGSELSPVLNTALGGGGFFRLNIPSDHVLMEIGGGYYQLTSMYTEKLTVIPAYMALVYKLPIEFALSFFLKAGGGAGYIINAPEAHEGILPVFFGGLETSFPAGKFINIGVRIDYYLLYETWMTADNNYQLVNGHFFSIGIMANFNTNP